MKGLIPLFLGIFGTFAFSWVGLAVISNWQIGHLNPQMEEDGTDVYPQPQSGMVERGRRVYAANGCVYCHSQQVRADYAADDIERKWGDRRSAPRDYIFERQVFLGKMRMGPDLANVGARAPAEQESAPAPPTGGAAPAGSPGQQPAVAPPSSPAPPGASPRFSRAVGIASRSGFAPGSRRIAAAYCFTSAESASASSSECIAWFDLSACSSKHESRSSHQPGDFACSDASERRTANLLRRLASQASLFATQH